MRSLCSSADMSLLITASAIPIAIAETSSLISLTARRRSSAISSPARSMICQNLSEHKGKKSYAYLDKNGKALTDEIVKIIAVDPRISEMYNLWHELRCETFRTYTDVMPDKIALEDNKEFKSIRNQVITVAANIGIPPDIPFHDEAYDYNELKDRKNDIGYLEALTDLGNPVAMYRAGRYYLEQDYDPDEALHWFKLAADHGNELAMYQIYKGYRDGKFTENNSDKIRYLRMAVDAKFGFAEYEYAKIQDKMQADIKLEYLKRAVEHGCTQAIYALGRLCYDEGKLDPQSNNSARILSASFFNTFSLTRATSSLRS